MIVAIGLLFLLNFTSSSKDISCKVRDVNSYYVGKILRTCNLNYKLSRNGNIIASPADVSVESLEGEFDISVIPDKISEKFPSLILLRISYSPVKFVGENHFKGLGELIMLYLQYNKIENIERDALKHNPKIEMLNLNNNNLKYISYDLFNSLHSLKVLNLSGNKMQHIDTRTFTNLINLEHIFLGRNKLEIIDENLLRNNRKLSQIGFEFNKINSISSEMFASMKDLSFVSFEGNFCINDDFSESFERMISELREKCYLGYLSDDGSDWD